MSKTWVDIKKKKPLILRMRVPNYKLDNFPKYVF